jgi:hypothetical protein
MPAKKMIIDSADISRVIVTLTFEVLVADNIEEAMANVRATLKSISSDGEIEDVNIKMEVNA